jgi:(1->4)-alpha-D-glucan 1-alpha-D-glucosylmutase
MSRIPTSTYRMQFHHGFQFADAERLVGYLAKLGIGDLYASPVLNARTGSLHGYDVIDPSTLNPELGGEDEFSRLVEALKNRNMGLLLDIVPNHISSSLENPWWYDVLTFGRQSAYAPWFDIDWNSSVPGLTGKVLLPVLGGQFEEVLESGELVVEHDGDTYVVRYYDNRFPLAPESLSLIPHVQNPEQALAAVNGTPGNPGSFDTLEALLGDQHYRLAFWRVAANTINFRRFFDITDLVSLRAEDEETFVATHQLILDMVGRGDVTGLRIDHIDGLYDPASYLERLQVALLEQGNGGRVADKRFYVVVEKILSSDENIPNDWLTEGTSGYDFLNVLNGLFVENRAVDKLQRTYAQLRGSEPDFEALVYRRKLQVMAELFPGDIHRLAVDLWSIASATRRGHDLLLVDLELAIVEMIARFSVYRTYTRSEDVSAPDRERIDSAVSEAVSHNPDLEQPLRFVQAVATLDRSVIIDADLRQQCLRWVMRWQQFTGPIMAKGFEDTSLYVFNRLISLNEVGGEPDHFGVPVREFHPWMQARQERWPGAINATSTHDTKRSGDVRARINVLSELDNEWAEALTRWQRLNRTKKIQVGGALVPDGNEDHLIYHSMVGAWPFDMQAVPEFRERMKEYLLKAAREAKTHTSWLDQNEEYEAALTTFLDKVITDDATDPFIADFLQFQQVVALHGALNSLSQALLKITLPGVPDFYQGTELWDFSLVDPDNRRPVDYSLRSAVLDGLLAADDVDLQTLFDDWPSGRIKLLLIARALRARNDAIEVFQSGDYVPLIPNGEQARHIVAFSREHQERRIVVVAPRLTVGLARLNGQPLGTPPLGEMSWPEVTLPLPNGYPARWRNVISGEYLKTSDRGGTQVLVPGELFRTIPLALLVQA